MFKIIIGYTNLGTRQLQGRLGSRVYPIVTPNANMAGYPTKNVFTGKIIKKNTFVSPSKSRDVPAVYIINLGDTKVIM